LPLLTHDFYIIEDYDSYSPYNSVSEKNIESVLLDNGETVRFMKVQSTKGLLAGINFGLYSDENFPIKAGETYRLSFLCAIHPNALSPLDFTYILTAGNTVDPNQKLYFPATETNEIYANTTGTFILPVYKIEFFFEANYTDETSRFLIGSKTSKDLGAGSYGLIFVADIKIEHEEEYQREYERSLYADLDKNYLLTDFFNYEDLDRIEEGIKVLNKKYVEFHKKDIGIITEQNLVPISTSHTGMTNWYNNLSFEDVTMPTGRKGFKVRMVSIETNPRMRLVAIPNNVAWVEKGRTYTFSVIFNPSVRLTKAELIGLYYYLGVETTFWQNFSSVDISAMPIENYQDDTREYSVTFTAEATGGVRVSFGFGLGNPDIDNGTWVNIVDMILKEVRSEKTILFSDELNRIESNIEKLGFHLGEPYNFSRPRTDWNYNSPFSYIDLNRITRNINNLYWYLALNMDYVPYTGQYITGEEGVF
jgi:hypothetical protein